MYQCWAQDRGALLSVPHKSHRKNILHLKVFEEYIRDNVEQWFRWSKKMKLAVEHMEDLILVTGCDLVTSWAAAAFECHMPRDPEPTTISLETKKLDGGRAEFFWRNIRGGVAYRNSEFNPVRSQAISSLRELMLPSCTRTFKNLYLRINASSSGVFVQSAHSSGSKKSVLQQNPFLTTLTTTGRMGYK